MFGNLGLRFATAACLPLAIAVSANAVTFKVVTTLDGFALSTGLPGSVAAYGDDVYIGALFGGDISHITDPLGTPTNIGSFGSGPPGNGYVSLSTDGTTLAAVSNNAGGNDVVESYAVGNPDTLNYSLNPGAVTPVRSRFDGGAVDPNTGNIFVTSFGSGFPVILDPTTGADNSSGPSSLFTGGTGTGFRDVEFDNATGDIYLRAVNGVARGNRNGPDDFAQPDGGGAGVDAIVNLGDGFNSAINVEFLPASFTGQNTVILNFRNGADTFNDQVLLYDADAVDTVVPATYLNGDGSTFVPGDAGSGIYDFSFDPVNELLYVADFSEGVVHVFTVVPEPTGALLVAAAASMAFVRRR